MRTVAHYLYGNLAGTTKNETKLQDNVKTGFFCVFSGGCSSKNSPSLRCADLENRSFLLIIVYAGCGYFSVVVVVVVVVVVFVVFSLVLIILVLRLLEGLITAVQIWFKLKLSDSLTDLAITMFVIAER